MSTASAPKTKRLRLDRSSNGMLMTPEEFDAVSDCDDRYVYELIHGVLIVSPIPGAEERGPNETLGHWLLSHKEHHPQGFLIDATLPEHTLAVEGNRRRADRAIWCHLGRQPRIQTDIPAILAEFVSKRKRDRVRDYQEKRREYHALGVQEYWIIDRFQRTMTVFKNIPGEPAEVIVKETDIYRTALLPGFDLPLARLLKIADDWAKAKSDCKKSPGRTKKPS